MIDVFIWVNIVISVAVLPFIRKDFRYTCTNIVSYYNGGCGYKQKVEGLAVCFYRITAEKKIDVIIFIKI
jgi:hypothetical protein